MLRFVVFALILSASVLAQDSLDPAPSEKSVADAGRELKDAWKERLRAGEPLTPAHMLGTCEWSRRICLAELMAATDRAAKEKAAEDHYRTVTSMRDVLISGEPDRDNVPPLLYRQVKFFVAEAALWKAQAKADKRFGGVD